MKRTKSMVTSVVGGLAALTLLAGCSSSAPSAGEADGDGITLKISEFAYTIPVVANEMIRSVAEDHPDLGVKEIESVEIDQATAWAGAAKGDIDLMTEVALPNNQEALDANADTVTNVATMYGPAEQGWYVPKYLVSPDGEAPKLKSVSQLNDYVDLFDGTIISGDPAWKATEYDHLRVDGYGLDYTLLEASDVARLAEMDKLYSNEKPFIIYLYQPSWVFSEYDLVLLEESEEFSEDCFADGGSQACGHPIYTSWVMARKDVQDRAPKFWDMLERFTIPMDDLGRMEREVDNGRDVSEVVDEWMTDNTDLVNSWVNG